MKANEPLSAGGENAEWNQSKRLMVVSRSKVFYEIASLAIQADQSTSLTGSKLIEPARRTLLGNLEFIEKFPLQSTRYCTPELELVHRGAKPKPIDHTLRG